MRAQGSERASAWIVRRHPPDLANEPPVEPTLWGLSVEERLRRSLLRAGVGRIERFESGHPPRSGAGRCLLLRDDLVYDERIVQGLLDAGEVVVEHAFDAGPEPVAGCCRAERLEALAARMRGEPGESIPELKRVLVRDLAPDYHAALRKQSAPFVYRAREQDRRQVEDRIFEASYKGITDAVTKWVFPRPARAAVRGLAAAGVSPNAVTTASYALAIVVTGLFAQGWLALGLVLGWLLSFLDTVDGKLARCTLTSTRFGGAFDHALDLVHPPFWWLAFAAGLPGGLEEHAVAAGITLGGYAIGRILEGAFLLCFGIQLFEWQPFDAAFRQVVARRNPNLLLLSLGVVLGAPAWGYGALAAWTMASVGIAATRLAQALWWARRGRSVRSWLASA